MVYILMEAFDNQGGKSLRAYKDALKAEAVAARLNTIKADGGLLGTSMGWCDSFEVQEVKLV
jgi:hypothetical protein